MTDTSAGDGPRSRVPSQLRRSPVGELFGQRDFLLYWLSSAVFAIGIWAFLTSMGWAALELTDSAFSVSLVNAVYFLPMFLFALPAGVLADVWDRRWNSIVSRSLSGAVMVVMTLLAMADALTYPLLVAFGFAIGLSIVSELAARQAYLAQIVQPDQIINASALSAVQGGISRVIGPYAAGALVAGFGVAGGFGLFAVSNVLFVIAFLAIRTSGRVAGMRTRAPIGELVDGFKYLRSHRNALSIVVLSIAAGTVGWIYIALMPLMARDVLGGDARMLGLLGTAVGVGSIPGSVFLSFVRNFTSEGKVLALSMAAWGASLVVFAYSTSVALSMITLAVGGLGFGLQVVLVRTILLRIVDTSYHGRVLGTLMLTWGAAVVGILGGGSLADLLGVTHVIALSGVIIVAATALTLLANREIYRL